jgi:redox-sensitive bicupin YhaK (pirin superfamily)
MWVRPDTESIAPGYQQMDINDQLGAGGLVPVASGPGHDAAITIQQKDDVLWAARLNPGERIEVPDAAYGHIFMAKGSGELEANGRLDTGDAVRLTRADDLSLVAGHEGAEVLIWTTGATP